MGLGDFWLQSNNGKRYKIEDLKNLQSDDIAKNPKLQKFIQLFNLDSDGDGQVSVKNSKGMNEWKSIFTELKNAAGDDDILTDAELNTYIRKKHPNIDITASEVKEFFETSTIQKTESYSDIFGNFITDTIKDNKLAERSISRLNEDGNIETDVVYYENEKPSKKLKIIDKYQGEKLSERTITEKDEKNNTKTTFVTYTNEKISKQVHKTNDEVNAIVTYDYSEGNESPKTTIISKDKKGIREEVEFPDNKRIVTLYKSSGTIENFDKKSSKKLVQSVKSGKKVYTAEYDGKGNTFITVQKDETPETIAKVFHVKLSSLLAVNKGLKADSSLAMGSKLLIPVELEADSKYNAGRKTEGQIKKQVFGSVIDKIYASSISEYKIPENSAGKDVYEYAEKSLLRKGVKQNDPKFADKKDRLVMELMALNGQKADYTAGNKIKYVKKTLKKETIQELTSAGMPANEDNQLFYARFNYLSPAQQKNVISVLKQCQAKGIKDSQKINAEILKYYPELNLFDTDVKKVTKPTKAMVRKYLAQMLYAQIYAIRDALESTTYWKKNHPFLATAMNFDDWLQQGVEGLNDMLGTNMFSGIQNSDTRRILSAKVKTLFDKCQKLMILCDMEEKSKDESFDKKKYTYDYSEKEFDKLYKEIAGELNYDKIQDFITTLIKYEQAPESERKNPQSKINQQLKIAAKKRGALPTFDKLGDRVQRYTGNIEGGAGLVDLAFNTLLMYVSGGGMLIGKLAESWGTMAAKSTTQYMTKAATTKFGQSLAGKYLLGETSQNVVSSFMSQQMKAMVNAPLSAAFFTGTKFTDALADGSIDMNDVKGIIQSYEGLTKFIYLSSNIASPSGAIVKYLIGNTASRKATLMILSGAIKTPTTAKSVITALAKNSTKIGNVSEFLTSFGMNAEIMAVQDGISYGDAMLNLGQMDAVSKMVIAMVSRKNMKFPQPNQVKRVVEELNKYEIKDGRISKDGWEVSFKNEEELTLILIDRTLYEASRAGIDVSEWGDTKGMSAQDAHLLGYAKQIEQQIENNKEPFVLDDNRKITKGPDGIYRLVINAEGKEIVVRADSVEKFFKIGTEYKVDETTGELVKAEQPSPQPSITGNNPVGQVTPHKNSDIVTPQLKNPVANALAQREAQARMGILPAVEKIEMEDTYGISYKVSTNPLAGTETYFNGKKCATDKKELRKVFTDAGADLKDLETQRFLDRVVDKCKTKEDFIKASILVQGGMVNNSRFRYRFTLYFEKTADSKEAAILNMLWTKGYEESGNLCGGGQSYNAENVAKAIKENPVLYRLYAEALPLITNLKEYHNQNQAYKLAEIAQFIKTEEHVDAMLEMLKSDIEAKNAYPLERNLIAATIDKYFDAPGKKDSYIKLYKNLSQFDYRDYSKLLESPEKADAYYELITSDKYNFTPDELAELNRQVSSGYYHANPQRIKILLDKNIDLKNALEAEQYINQVNNLEFTSAIMESNNISEIYQHVFKSKWFDNLGQGTQNNLDGMRNYCANWVDKKIDTEKLATCIELEDMLHPAIFNQMTSGMFSSCLKHLVKDGIIPKDNIERIKTFSRIYREGAGFDDAIYNKAKEYLSTSESQNEYTLLMYYKIVKEGLDKETIETTLNNAKAKKNQIKSGLEDITDNDIEKFFAENTAGIQEAINLIGRPAFEYSFTSKFDGMERLCEAAEELYKNYNDLIRVLNDVKSDKSIEPKMLEQRLPELKKMIADEAKLLNSIKTALSDKSIEPQDKIKKLETLGALKLHCNSEEFNSFIDLIKPNKPTSAQVQQAVQIWSNPKAFYEDKWNAFCEAFGVEKDNAKVKAFFEKRATVNAKGFKILNGVKSADMQQFLSSIVREQNQKVWNNAINKKVFDVVGATYTEDVSKKLELASSPDLDLILAAEDGFKSNFRLMIVRLGEHPEMSVKETFDNLPQNINTKRQYAEHHVDYDKVTTPDKDSYKTVKIKVDAEKTRQNCVTNLVNEFNDVSFQSLPKEETQEILNALKKELGIELKTILEPQYDADGYLIGEKEVFQFFNADGSPITFNNLGKMMSVIKKAINANDFWSKKNPNAQIEQNRNTFYDHIMKSRDEEISNAENIKSDKTTEVSIQQVDMNEMPYGLMLGAKLCCTSPTGGNGFSAPTYVMNKCIGAFDIKDGKIPVGNTMMYLAEIEGRTALVLDNIEVKSGYQDNVVRDAFMDYVKEWCAEKGLGDIPIYAGPNRHKFEMGKSYPIEKHDVKIIGSTGLDEIYIDYKGKYIVDGNSSIDNVNMYVIRPPKPEPSPQPSITGNNPVGQVTPDRNGGVHTAAQTGNGIGFNPRVAPQAQNPVSNTVNPQVAKITAEVAGQKINATKLKADIERSVRKNLLDGFEALSSDKALSIDEKIFALLKDTKDNSKIDQNKITEIRKEIQTLAQTNPEEARNLELVLNGRTTTKKCSETTREEISAIVQHLRRQFELEKAEITANLERLGAKELGTFTNRVKSDMSEFDKIANFALNNPDKPFEMAVRDVRDNYGGRIELNSVDMKNALPEVQKLVNEGKTDEAGKLAMEKISVQVADFMRKIINDPKHAFEITRVSNYKDCANITMLDKVKMFELQKEALDSGMPIVVESWQIKQQGSAYPAFQVNVKTKSGKVLEIQIRLDEVGQYAEIEHYIYDLMTGKDIIGRKEKVAPLFEPLEKSLKENLTEEEYETYYLPYTRAQYHHRLLKALGIDTPEPRLEDFPAPPGKTFDARLKAENLFLLHDFEKKVKDEELTSDQALEIYNKAVEESTIPQNPANHTGLTTTAQETQDILTLQALQQNLKENNVSYEIMQDKEGNQIIRVVSDYKFDDINGMTDIKYNIYKYEKDGTVTKTENIPQKEVKAKFGKNWKIVDNSVSSNSGTLNSTLIPFSSNLRIPSWLKNSFGFGLNSHPAIKISDITKPTKQAKFAKPLEQNSPIYRDINKLSEYLSAKFEEQAGNITSSEIQEIVKNISTKYNVSEDIVLSIISRLTQFGSYKQLDVLGARLKEMGIEKFYIESYIARNDTMTDVSKKTSLIGISTNASLYYIQSQKEQFSLATGTGKEALILDDASLKYMEKLKQNNDPEYNEILKNIKTGTLVLINLDGTGLQVENQYFSYTAFDGGQNLASLTEAVLQQANGKSKNLNSVLNSSFAKRIEALFGIDIAQKIENINIESQAQNPETISAQIRQKVPSSDDIKMTIDEIINQRLGKDCSQIDRITATTALGKYYDNFGRIYSSEGMAELLKTRHNQIQQIVQNLGKSMDDVVFFAPYINKSFGLIAQMYSKVNDIPADNFVVFGGAHHKMSKRNDAALPDGKVIVLLDDVIGSGNSALSQLVMNYSEFVQTHPNSNIIFSPIVCANSGIKAITENISGKWNGQDRTGKDFLLVDEENMFSLYDSRYNAGDMPFNIKYSIDSNALKNFDYQKMPYPSFLTEKDINDINNGKVISGTNGKIPGCFNEIKEINMFIKLNNDNDGYGNNGLCITFPYMTPDNSCSISAPLLLHCLSNPQDGTNLKAADSSNFKIVNTIIANKNNQ